MITIFGGKNGVFLKKNNIMIFFAKRSSSLSKKGQFFSPKFSDKIFLKS
jgi:hypothetical protein